MAQLDDLLKYVRTGTAEGDRTFLDRVFIMPNQFAQLCGIELGGMRILVGTKGMGKSAILEWIERVSIKRGLPCLLIRPDNISNKPFPPSNDIGSLKHHYFDLLVSTVSAQIGAKLSGLLTGNAAKLYNEARASGLTNDDFIQKSLAVVSAVSMPVAKINGAALSKELSGTNSAHALTKAVNQQLLAAGSLFFLLIDDTDQIASPDTPAHLNRIWALLLAVRRLTSECPSVRAMVTLRSEVWTRLTSESQGQRDQTDHMRGLVIFLKADNTLMANIIRRRLELAAKDSADVRRDPYLIFFSGTTMTLPMSDAVRTWDDFIIKSARERPRDAIQLIKSMIDSAIRHEVSVIGSNEAEDAMIGYSSERVDDVENEFALDCKNIRQVIDTFSDISFEVDFETLRSHLAKVPSVLSVQIRGRTLKPQDDDDALILLSLLHETGFINPRLNDVRQPRGFRHELFQESPHFAKRANWNKLQGSHWEVHPAFRTYLIGAKRAALARVMNKSSSTTKR